VARIKRDELLNCANSIYKLAILASKRAQELNQGGKKLVEAALNEKPTTIALQEIVAKKITYKLRG